MSTLGGPALERQPTHKHKTLSRGTERQTEVLYDEGRGTLPPGQAGRVSPRSWRWGMAGFGQA